MKKKKNIVAIIVLFLVIGVCISTYAIYKSSATGTATATAAAWVITVNDTDIVTNNTYTFTGNDITWSNMVSNAATGTIAPGSTGQLTIRIDADGTQVPVDYEVEIGDVNVTGVAISDDAGFTVTKAVSSPNLTGTINYDPTEHAMETTITLDVIWDGTDETDKNNADVGLAGSGISIPVTVTTKQHLTSLEPVIGG